MALWIALRRRRPAAAALFVLATLLPIAPVTLRNLRAGGEWVPISANGGINFYMGNNPDARRLSTLRPGPEWREMQELPVREAGLVKPGARDRWFLQQGLRFWADHPFEALRFTAEKALLLVHDHEIMRDFDFYWFRDHFSAWLRVPGWSFALLFALALVGMVRARTGSAGERLLLLFLACYAAGVVLFFVTSRYRAPLVPVLAVFAGQGIAWIARRVRARDRRALATTAALVVAALGLSYVDLFGVDRVDEAEARYRVATTFEKRGEFEEALRRYDEVLGLAPDHPVAAARAALCAQMLGRTQEAVNRYENLLDRHPNYAEAAINLATMAWKHGEPQVAQGYFELALEIDPYLPQAHASYGLFQLERGEARAAVEPLARALALDPAWEALRVDLARALVAAGQPARAWDEIQQAAAVLPPSDRVEMVRGDALQAAGRPDEARLAWERGLRLNPSNTTLQQRLGAQP
jgi:tetratricopeptide (TPR) repeat protein